jgi:hypothetical protein
MSTTNKTQNATAGKLAGFFIESNFVVSGEQAI